jgi:hypothetical protein
MARVSTHGQISVGRAPRQVWTAVAEPHSAIGEPVFSESLRKFSELALDKFILEKIPEELVVYIVMVLYLLRFHDATE